MPGAPPILDDMPSMIPRWPGVARAALVAFVPLMGAVLLTMVAASIDGLPFEDVVLLPPDPLGSGRFVLGLAVLLVSYAAVYAAPGLLILRALRLTLPSAAGEVIAAFVLSLSALSAGWMVAMAVTDGPAGRTCLWLTVAAIDAAALLVAVFRSPGAPALSTVLRRDAREVVVPLAGVVLLVAVGWALMPGKITVEALEGDATEVHGFAASLFERALPYWDLESGAWGFYPTFMFVAYPVFFSLAALGPSEAALRLPALLFLGVTLLALADLAGRGRAVRAGADPRVLVPLLACGYLVMQAAAYYAGYHPFHGDLGCSPLEEWMVTGLALAAVVLVRDDRPLLAAVAALLSILTFPSGLMLVGLLGLFGLATASPERRGAVWRFGLTLAGMMAVYAAALTVSTLANGTFDAMIGEWYSKYFEGRAGFAREGGARILLAVGWFVLLCGGLPFFGIFAALRGDGTARWLALATGVWVAFFAFSPNKNMHYFLPVALLPVAVALRTLVAEGTAVRSFGPSVALTGSALACVLLCRPASVPPYTADREFGRSTIFLAPDERTAVDYSKVLFNLSAPLWRWKPGDPWTIGHHTWVLYADRGYDLERDYDFYVAEGPPPVDGLREISRVALPGGGTARLWSPRGRAALREWRGRSFPLRTELSRFNFEMAVK